MSAQRPRPPSAEREDDERRLERVCRSNGLGRRLLPPRRGSLVRALGDRGLLVSIGRGLGGRHALGRGAPRSAAGTALVEVVRLREETRDGATADGEDGSGGGGRGGWGQQRRMGRMVGAAAEGRMVGAAANGEIGRAHV